MPSRKPNMRWRESDAEKLNREIERFNSKIYRARSKDPENKSILPDTIKKADKQKLIEELKNAPRSEYNKTLKSLDRFIDKDATKVIESESGLKLTKWEKQEVSYKVAQINRSRTLEKKKRDDVDVTSRGEPIGLKRGEMGSVRMNELRHKKFDIDKIRPGKEWEKFKQSVDYLSSPKAVTDREERYKQNYIKSLENNFGSYADDIITKIQGMSAEDVVDLFYSEQEADISFTYGPEEMTTKLNVLREVWKA